MKRKGVSMASLRSSALPSVFLLLLFPASSAETKSSASSARSAGGRGLIGVRLNAKTRSIDLGSVSIEPDPDSLSLSLSLGADRPSTSSSGQSVLASLKRKSRERRGMWNEERVPFVRCRFVSCLSLSLRLIPARPRLPSAPSAPRPMSKS